MAMPPRRQLRPLLLLALLPTSSTYAPTAAGSRRLPSARPIVVAERTWSCTALAHRPSALAVPPRRRMGTVVSQEVATAQAVATTEIRRGSGDFPASSSIDSGEMLTSTSLRAAATKRKGRLHTAESRAKISAANKGRQPWNTGRAHSEETRQRIAEGTRRAAQKRAEEKRLAREKLQREDPKAYARMVAEEAEAAAKLDAARKEREREKRKRRAEKAKEVIPSRPSPAAAFVHALQDPPCLGSRCTCPLPSRDLARSAVQVRRLKALEREAELQEQVRRGELDPAAANRVRRGRMTTASGGRVNFTFSAESRRKISQSLRKRWEHGADGRRPVRLRPTSTSTPLSPSPHAGGRTLTTAGVVGTSR